MPLWTLGNAFAFPLDSLQGGGGILFSLNVCLVLTIPSFLAVASIIACFCNVVGTIIRVPRITIPSAVFVSSAFMDAKA